MTLLSPIGMPVYSPQRSSMYSTPMPIHHVVGGVVLDVQGHLLDEFMDQRRQAAEHPFQLGVETAACAIVHVAVVCRGYAMYRDTLQ